jgi:hypothetical protein
MVEQSRPSSKSSKPVNPLRVEPLFTAILDTTNDIARARGYSITVGSGQCGLVLDAIWLLNRTQAAQTGKKLEAADAR